MGAQRELMQSDSATRRPIRHNGVFVELERCKNCSNHAHCTSHQEEKYDLYEQKVRQALEGCCAVEVNPGPKAAGVRFRQVRYNPHLFQATPRQAEPSAGSAPSRIGESRTTMYPRLGAFELYVCRDRERWEVFSKLATSKWPNFESLLPKLTEAAEKLGGWDGEGPILPPPPPIPPEPAVETAPAAPLVPEVLLPGQVAAAVENPAPLRPSSPSRTAKPVRPTAANKTAKPVRPTSPSKPAPPTKSTTSSKQKPPGKPLGPISPSPLEVPVPVAPASVLPRWGDPPLRPLDELPVSPVAESAPAAPDPVSDPLPVMAPGAQGFVAVPPPSASPLPAISAPAAETAATVPRPIASPEAVAAVLLPGAVVVPVESAPVAMATATPVCDCGSVFMPQAMFCACCGQRREQTLERSHAGGLTELCGDVPGPSAPSSTTASSSDLRLQANASLSRPTSASLSRPTSAGPLQPGSAGTTPLPGASSASLPVALPEDSELLVAARPPALQTSHSETFSDLENATPHSSPVAQKAMQLLPPQVELSTTAQSATPIQETSPIAANETYSNFEDTASHSRLILEDSPPQKVQVQPAAAARPTPLLDSALGAPAPACEDALSARSAGGGSVGSAGTGADTLPGSLRTAASSVVGPDPVGPASASIGIRHEVGAPPPTIGTPHGAFPRGLPSPSGDSVYSEFEESHQNTYTQDDFETSMG